MGDIEQISGEVVQGSATGPIRVDRIMPSASRAMLRTG